jgi:hypothetical protein
MVRHQAGLSVFALLLLLSFISLVAVTAVRVVPLYYDHWVVGRMVYELESAGAMGAVEIRNTLLKRMDINNIDRIRSEEITILRQGDSYDVTIAYEVRRPLVANIDLLFNFHHQGYILAK